MQPLNARARELAAGFGEVSYEWIPRAKNTHADRLANEAMDAATAASAAESVAADSSGVNAAPGWTGATGTPTRILLLRHGQTELSRERRYSGRGDLPLTELGRAQAAAAAARLAGEAEGVVVVSSPLTRCMQTAAAVAEAAGGKVVTHEGLIETDFGAWEGLTFAEAAQRDPELHARWLRDPSVPAPGGESFDRVHRRVRFALNDLVEAHAGTTIVVVSHVTPIKSLLRMGLDVGPSLLFRLHLDLASLSIVEFYPDGNASVRLVNDTSYLPAAG
jgi:probable phosphoglycerate mutase